MMSATKNHTCEGQCDTLNVHSLTESSRKKREKQKGKITFFLKFENHNTKNNPVQRDDKYSYFCTTGQ